MLLWRRMDPLSDPNGVAIPVAKSTNLLESINQSIDLYLDSEFRWSLAIDGQFGPSENDESVDGRVQFIQLCRPRIIAGLLKSPVSGVRIFGCAAYGSAKRLIDSSGQFGNALKYRFSRVRFPPPHQ